MKSTTKAIQEGFCRPDHLCPLMVEFHYSLGILKLETKLLTLKPELTWKVTINLEIQLLTWKQLLFSS